MPIFSSLRARTYTEISSSFKQPASQFPPNPDRSPLSKSASLEKIRRDTTENRPPRTITQKRVLSVRSIRSLSATTIITIHYPWRRRATRPLFCFNAYRDRTRAWPRGTRPPNRDGRRQINSWKTVAGAHTRARESEQRRSETETPSQVHSSTYYSPGVRDDVPFKYA